MDIYWWFKSENSRSLGLVITASASQPATEDERMVNVKLWKKALFTLALVPIEQQLETVKDTF
jgi:hypothetical protein